MNDIIKDLINQLIKMYKEFIEYKKYLKFLYFRYNIYINIGISNIKKELIKEYFNHLKNKYQIDINLSDLIFIINNYNIDDKMFKSDLNLNQIDLLHLFDFKYLNNNFNIRIKIKTINKKSMNRIKKINYIIVNFKGGDKLYNIVLFKHKIEYSILCDYINKTYRIHKDKKRTFFKKHKYNYQLCKNKVFLNKEKTLLHGKKYSHNFKNNHNHYKKYNDMDYTYNLLSLLLDSYYSNKDLLDLYINDMNIKNHIINIKIIMERLVYNMEVQYNNYKKSNKDKYYITFKFMLDNYNKIKLFLFDIKEYQHCLIKNSDLYNKQTNINDYNNSSNIKDCFIYHYKTMDKI